jgi:hypothetical protein
MILYSVHKIALDAARRDRRAAAPAMQGSSDPAVDAGEMAARRGVRQSPIRALIRLRQPFCRAVAVDPQPAGHRCQRLRQCADAFPSAALRPPR